MLMMEKSKTFHEIPSQSWNIVDMMALEWNQDVKWTWAMLRMEHFRDGIFDGKWTSKISWMEKDKTHINFRL